MVSITHLKDNVDLIELGDKKIYLVGTAHISQTSADLAKGVIREYQPQSVAVELCDSRFQAIQNPDRWKNTDIISVLKEGRGYVLLMQLLLAGFQKKLGDKLKIKPGAEMIAAIESAREVGAEIVLADREVKTTLKRVWGSLGMFQMMKLFGSMFGGVFSEPKIDEKEIERLKSSDALAELMKDFADAFPTVRETLIDERDKFLAMKIKHAPGERIVAIVGAGHVPGILSYIDKEINLSELCSLPPKKLSKQVVKWIVPTIVLAMVIYGFLHLGISTSLHMLWIWCVVTGLFAAMGALLVLGHPLTIAAAAVSAPLTALHPGWVAGFVEAFIRKPRVVDLETIIDDITSVKGWWRNRVSRILLIMAFTNILARIGTGVSAVIIAKML